MIDKLIPATVLRWLDDNREVLIVIGIYAGTLAVAFLLGAWIF